MDGKLTKFEAKRNSFDVDLKNGRQVEQWLEIGMSKVQQALAKLYDYRSLF